MALLSDVSAVVARDLAAYYRRAQRRVREVAAPLDDARFWTRPFPYGNSIGHLVLHLTGNMRFYMGTKMLDTGYVRDRPLEFSDARRLPKEEVLRAFDEAVDVVVRALEAQGEADWGRAYEAEGVTVDEVPTRFAAFLRSAAHVDLHLGQMMYVRKELDRSPA